MLFLFFLEKVCIKGMFLSARIPPPHCKRPWLHRIIRCLLSSKVHYCRIKEISLRVLLLVFPLLMGESDVPKCMSCHKAIVGITGRAHCFHDNIYIYVYIYIYIYKCIKNSRRHFFIKSVIFRILRIDYIDR